MDWFLYDRDFRHERVKTNSLILIKGEEYGHKSIFTMKSFFKLSIRYQLSMKKVIIKMKLMIKVTSRTVSIKLLWIQIIGRKIRKEPGKTGRRVFFLPAANRKSILRNQSKHLPNSSSGVSG